MPLPQHIERKHKIDRGIDANRAEGKHMLQAVEASRVVSEQDARWKTLRSIVKRESLQEGNFTLSSGRQSHYLFQLRQTTLHPEGSHLVGHIIAEFMANRGVRCAGGLELGAVPVVTAIACASHSIGKPAHVFFVRKKAKEHGAKELVNGYIDDGEDILAVDDVTTTGGSMMTAIRGVAAERGCRVAAAVSIVDREEGAAEALAAEGIPLFSIFRKGDFAI